MKNHRTRIGIVAAVAVAVAVATLAVVTGCAGGGDSAKGGTLSMYTWVSSQSDRQQWESFVALGKKNDPDLKVSIDGPNFSDYWTKVKTRLSGSNPPCLLTTQAARAQELKGLLMPLNDLIKKYKVDTTEFDSSMLKGMTVDGTVRALPYDAEPIVLYYNADMFRAAGLSLPTVGYTKKQFVSDAKALTANGTTGFAIAPGMSIPSAWAAADGQGGVKNGKLDLTDSKFVSEVQSYFDLVHQENLAKAPEASDGSDVAQAAFTGGDAAMLMEGPWMYGTFKDAAKFDLGVAVVPTESGTARGMTQGSGFGVAANCKQPDQAFKAIVAMTKTNVLEAQAKTRGIVPSRADAVAAWADGKPAEANDAVTAMLKDASPYITTPTWNQVDTLMSQYGVEGYRGDKTAAEIMATIQKSVNE